MGKSVDNTILYKGTGLTIGEISTVVGDSSKDLGTLCRSQNINPWAKYKPFKSSALYFASAADWLTAVSADTVRYGFGRTENTMSYNWGYSSPEWCGYYHNNPPSGGIGVEPYRQLDFVDMTDSSTYGYDKNAVHPLKITFDSGDDTGLHQMNSGVNLKMDGYANASWNSNTCIAFNDVFPASLDSGAHKYKFAVLLKWKPSWSQVFQNNLIVSNYGPSTLNASGVNIPFSGDIESPDHIYSPLLAGLGEGDQVTVVAGLVYEEWNPPTTSHTWGYLYDQGAGSSPTQYYGNIISLNFKNLSNNTGMDIWNTVVHEKNSIVNMTGSVEANITRLGRINYNPQDGTTYTTYRIDRIQVNLDTTNCENTTWGDRSSVNVELFITFGTQYAYTDTFYVHASEHTYNASSDVGKIAISTIPPDDEFDNPAASSNEFYRVLSDRVQSDANKDVIVSVSRNQTVSRIVLYSSGQATGGNELRPYFSFNDQSGQAKTITISGFAYMGNDPDNPGYRINLTPTSYNLTY